MKRKLILLNVALLVVLAGLGWRLRQEWLGSKAREAKVLGQKVTPLKPIPPPANPPAAPLVPATYLEVADKMLFAKDRNPNVIIDVEVPKPEPPMPPLPAVYGVMMFAEPTVILGFKGTDQHSFRPGETVGEFKLLSVDNKDIVFEWNGKKVERKVADLMAKEAVQVTSSAPAAASQGGVAPLVNPVVAQQGGTVQPAASPTAQGSQLGPGQEMGNGYRSCQANDSTPAGTIVNGLRKQVLPSPMGKSCVWEPVGVVK